MAAHLKLNNGATIPALGLGTITFNDSPEKIKNAILTALRVLPTPPTFCSWCLDRFAGFCVYTAAHLVYKLEDLL